MRTRLPRHVERKESTRGNVNPNGAQMIPAQMNPGTMIASHPEDLVNHIIRDSDRGTLFAWCGESGFRNNIPDCSLKAIAGDSVQMARLCPKCLKRLSSAGFQVPQFEGRIWNSLHGS